MKILNICGHSFLGNLLKAAPVVLDCGANEGLFSHNIHQKYNKSIIHGFEPDPRLYPELPSIPNVEFHQLAISGNNGNINLFLGDTRNSSTRFEEAPEQNHVLVNAITLAQFCQDNFIEYIVSSQ